MAGTSPAMTSKNVRSRTKPNFQLVYPNQSLRPLSHHDRAPERDGERFGKPHAFIFLNAKGEVAFALE
jgi:hypothetical protein